MFKEIDYYEQKMNIWDCDKKFDLEKLAPPNLRYTNTIDTVIEFYKPVQNYDEYSVDFYSLIKKDSCILLTACETYYFYRNFNITDFSSTVLINALNLPEEDIPKACMLFDEVIFDEHCPIFEDQCIKTYIQGIQTAGLSDIGMRTVKRVISENEWLDRLYNGKIQSDISETKFYEYEKSGNIETDSKTKEFVDSIFESEYMKKCGSLNVSSMTLEELENSALCEYIAEKTEHLYLQNIDFEYEGKLYYTKFLWFS